MRILSALTYYHPHVTGLTAHARQLAEGLVRRHHTVTVLTHQHDPSLPPREIVGGVCIERARPVLRASPGMVSPEFFSAARRLIRSHDAVIIHTPMFESLPIALLCQSARRPLLVVHHGDVATTTGVTNRMVERMTVGSMIGTARIARRITTYSEDYGEHSDFLLPFRPKLVVIPPAVEIPAPNPAAAAAWRRELGLENNKIVGFASRFAEEKGAGLLLRAMRLVIERVPDARMVMAADIHLGYSEFHNDARSLLMLLGGYITKLGRLTDRQRLADFYAMCDVLALPSRADSYALVQPEAMLCGTPVVASDVPGTREPVLRTRMGRLFEPLDVGELATGLIDVLDNPVAYRQPRAEIEAAFDSERSIGAYEDLLFDILGGAPATVYPIESPPLGRRKYTLAGSDRAILDDLLTHEPDPAFRRRMLVLFEYLDLQDNDRVLDGGCGTGFALLAMEKLRRVQVTGLALRRRELISARRRGIHGKLVAADVVDLPFAPASFDKILLADVLEHVTDDRTALKQVFRVLRPGGTVAISVPHADYPFWWDPINKLWSASGGAPLRKGPLAGIWSGRRRLYWPEDLRQRVIAAGFEVERSENVTHHSFPFSHLLVHGIRKPLVERGWIAARPHALGGKLMRTVDRRNERLEIPPETYVNVLLKATKPSS